MAQKALKTLAARNAATLNRLHLISLLVHTFFILSTFLFRRRSRLAWVLVSLPAFAIEFWFERIARPTYHPVSSSPAAAAAAAAGDGELRRAGEDLDAKGLTEWMWDVIYWTWGVVGVAGLVGNWAWWLYGVVPLYSAWLAYTTFTGARNGLSGFANGSAGAGAGNGAGQSKRQAKMEKRGGQRVQYR